MTPTRDEMIDHLTDRICRVVFTKKNGEERVMRCTRNMTIIPESFHPKGVESKENEEVISVFDILADGWRSFRVANVTKFE
ncbi:MAG: SH3 beta-barrel fold-containing protein [Candidatus Poseidoniales archaeon]|jgi:hypothetical protein